MIAFALGVACVAALLGFLVGASESPVAGIALTATFGIVATGLALHQRAAGVPQVELPAVAGIVPPESSLAQALRSLGQILVTFSFAFAFGLSVGIYAKLQFHKVQGELSFPWLDKQPPTSARKAIDWIVVRTKLRELGYSDSQIAEIYQIEVTTKKEDDKPFSLKEEPLLSSILASVAATSSPKSNPPVLAMDPKLKERSGGV